MDKFTVFIIAMIFALLGYCIGIIEGNVDRRDLKADIVGAPVKGTVYYDTGCSFLIQRPDQTREWLWLPKLVPDKEGK